MAQEWCFRDNLDKADDIVESAEKSYEIQDEVINVSSSSMCLMS